MMMTGCLFFYHSSVKSAGCYVKSSKNVCETVFFKHENDTSFATIVKFVDFFRHKGIF